MVLFMLLFTQYRPDVYSFTHQTKVTVILTILPRI